MCSRSKLSVGGAAGGGGESHAGAGAGSRGIGVSAGDGASFETFSVEALRLAGLHSDVLEVIDGDTLGRPAPRPRNSRLKCLLSEAIGLPALPRWEDGLARFINRG